MRSWSWHHAKLCKAQKFQKAIVGMSLDDIKKKLLDSTFWSTSWACRMCSGMHPRKAQKPELRQAREQAAKESVGDADGIVQWEQLNYIQKLNQFLIWSHIRDSQEAKAKQMAEKKKASSSSSLRHSKLIYKLPNMNTCWIVARSERRCMSHVSTPPSLDGSIRFHQ